MHNKKVLIRVHGQGVYDTEHVAIFLERFSAAYKSLSTLDTRMKMLTESGYKINLAQLNITGYAPEHYLDIIGVEFHSPGFWEFLGKLNPLEVLRQYLNDRHERKKDEDYRNTLEKEKLGIENDILKLEFTRQVIEVARQTGHSEEEIRSIVRDQIVIPLISLDALSEKGMVTYVEIPEDEKELEFEVESET
ncbi:TPA: hypothetical protein RUZ30_003577 [Vibrio cholerae]|nr:hypothetical protein [Vibrio cholerae]